jgi:hypothetical protein
MSTLVPRIREQLSPPDAPRPGHRGDRTAIGAPAVTSRPLDAYRDMFRLDDSELTAGPILDCPAGASPFGAQVRALGGEVVSVDPAYARPDTLVTRARADLDRIVSWQRTNPAGFDWSYLGSPERVRRWWGRALETFAADFTPDGRRYVAAALPVLPFPDQRFSTTVSGFLLFTHPQLFDFADHLDALLELVRVTRAEVRVFPLHDTAGRPYPHLELLRIHLHERGVRTELRPSGCSYSPDPESSRMLVCRRAS